MRRSIITIALAALLLIALPAAAWGMDDPDMLADRPAAENVAEDAAFTVWSSRIEPTAVDAPIRYLYTQYCPQERAYWCGPAAVQTALTYFGLKPSQTTIAGRLRTTLNGTSMTLVDDVLRSYTGRRYTFHTATNSTDFYNHVLYSVYSQRRPLVVDVRIRAGWGPYRKDHAGHILTLDGMDWRRATVRVDDSYDERLWQSGGGYTGGPTTYARSLMWTAIALHPAHAIVY